jgi:hypothetical protein
MNAEFAGAIAGVIIGLSLLAWSYAKTKDDIVAEVTHNLHVACLNGGGVWESGACRRPQQ